jgi:VWFA-related protein
MHRCFRYDLPMSLRWRNTYLKLAVSSGLGFALMAAQPQESNSAQVQLRIESNLVVVRVVVRNGEGLPVGGLKKDLFKVFDRGKEQSIVQFEEESAVGAPSASAPASVPGQSATPSPAVEPERYIAFYFDDLDTSDADMIQARDAADRYLALNLRAQDRVAIFTTGKMLSNFTSNPKQIHEALFQLHASSRALSRVHECPDLSDYQAQEMMRDSDPHSNVWMAALAEARICAPPPDIRSTATGIRMLAERITAQAQAQARENVQQFTRVINYIAQTPARRTVVLVSPGFLSESEQLAINRAIDRALRAQVVVNSLDPKGLAVLMREADASNSSMILPDPRATQARHNLDEARKLVGSDVLAEVAQGTGGQFFHDNNDLKAGLDALAGHPAEYVLAFAPKDVTQDGKFHELKVTLAEKQKGYTIQARRGYFALRDEPGTATQTAQTTSQTKNQSELAAEVTPAKPLNSEPAGGVVQPQTPSPDEEIQQQIQNALRSKTDSVDLPVGLEASPSEGEGPTRLLALTVHLDTRSLPLRKEAEHRLDALTFAVAVFDEKDNIVEVKQRHAKVELTDDQLPDFLSNGMDVNSMFEVKPGTYRLRVAVIEFNEHRLAAFSRAVVVP